MIIYRILNTVNGKSYVGQKKRFSRDGALRLGSIGKLNPRSIPIVCIELNTTFESARQAALVLGLNRAHVSAVARGKRRSIGGYTFKYLNIP